MERGESPLFESTENPETAQEKIELATQLDKKLNGTGTESSGEGQSVDSDLEKSLETSNPFYGMEGNEGYVEDLTDLAVEEDGKNPQATAEKNAAARPARKRMLLPTIKGPDNSSAHP
jgi:hypothetical protein